jgi:hypothetical protein
MVLRHEDLKDDLLPLRGVSQPFPFDKGPKKLYFVPHYDPYCNLVSTIIGMR